MGAAITSIIGLQNLTDLREFYADWNSLSTVNLSGLTNLVDVDISDNETPGTGANSLTSVTLTGCTALETLRLDDSDFSAGIPDLTGLTSLTYFDMDQCGITGAVDVSMLPALAGFDLGGNTGITSVTIFEQVLNDVNVSNAALTEASVNDILGWLDGGGATNGVVDLADGTNAIPTGSGITAKDNLIGKGWNVYVNQAAPGNVGIAPSTDFDIVGDFTIEMFVNMSNTNGNPRPYSFGVYPAANAISIENGTMYFWANNTPLISGTFNPTIGQWYHICVMGGGGGAYMFVDGFQVASSPYGGTISSQGLPLTIGFGNEPNSGFNGLMSNFRWTTSTVYPTGGFSVPTAPLFSIPVNTKLLTFQGDNLTLETTDNSSYARTITNDGATYSANNPFAGYAGSLQMGTPPALFSATVDVHEGPFCVSSPLTSFLVTGDGTTFCNSTQFTASGFTGVPSGTLALRYGTDILQVTTDGSDVAVVSFACYQCL